MPAYYYFGTIIVNIKANKLKKYLEVLKEFTTFVVNNNRSRT